MNQKHTNNMKTHKIDLNESERANLYEITGMLPTTTFHVLEAMMEFRKGLQGTEPLSIDTKLIAVIYNGLQQMQGIIPNETNLSIWKKFSKLAEAE
jgi:hypothetical protein